MTQTLVQDTAPSGPNALVLARGITAVATVLFVAFAAEAFPAALEAIRFGSAAPDGTLSAALGVDVALLLFCWRSGGGL